MTSERFSRRQVLRGVTAGAAALALSPWIRARGAGTHEKVLFDTDIGSDIDDAVALAYLLAQPRCELLGITTVSGEAARRAELASVLCHAAGKSRIPIFPGAERPLLVEPRQPVASQFEHVGTWRRQQRFAEAGAVEFLRATIREHPHEMTLLAVGPLTNVALLCRVDPGAVALLREIVLMAGVFAPQGVTWPDGNVSRAEWNVVLDPQAAAIVLETPNVPIRMYPLDVTMQVVLSRDDFHARLERLKATRPVLDFARAWFVNERRESQLHDPLAATGVFEPSICELARGRVAVNLENDNDFARTTFVADPAGHHQIAVRVDTPRFFGELFGRISG
jgi:purine nucleosidase